MQQVDLVDGLSVTDLGCTLLVLRRRIVVHGAPGGVTLLFSSHEEVTPAIERLVKTSQSAGHHLNGELISALEPRGLLLGQIIFQQIKHPDNPTKRLRGDSGRLMGSSRTSLLSGRAVPTGPGVQRWTRPTAAR